jgi:uncharacterized membrane protein HdeD (DUF308 family)
MVRTVGNSARLPLATQAQSRISAKNRARALRAAGVAIILLSAGEALLPAGKSISSDLVGGLLVAAGMIESVAGTLRREARQLAIAAGCITALAGLLFILNPTTHFFPAVTLIIAWLFLRAAILALAIRLSDGGVRTWTAISAGVDFLLGLLLMAGLSISTIVVSIFGPTPPMIASFAWFIAASFVANGLLLLEVSSCERELATG